MKELTPLATRLYDRMQAMPIADFAADFTRGSLAPTNLTEYLLSYDKVQLMQRMNSDEKYRNGQASDFELFEEWERIMPLCPGYGSAELYREEKQILEIATETDPREAWKRGNETLQKCANTPVKNGLNLNQFVSDFIKSNSHSSLVYETLVSTVSTALFAMKSDACHVISDLPDQDYTKPDPYHAALALRDIKRDEKNNIDLPSVLLSQVLIDLLLSAKKQGKVPVILHLRGRCARELVDYLADHRLLPQETRIGVSLRGMSAELSNWSTATSWNARILPELILSPADFGCALVSRLCALADAYPLGGIRFGGVQTDSAALVACHRVFCRSFAMALATLCDTEEQAILALQRFFS